MLPSLLTRDIQTGLRQYLLFAYEPTDMFFKGIMERFLDREGSWMKGPYVQVGLPFRPGAHGRKYFDTFETVYESFTHQEAAWARLASSGQTANTLVATGTGSGKTESFLYPVLDHCAREVAEGKPGIKVLIIYPMNALATDQARRIAETIARIPAFHNVRAGMYVGGGGSAEPGGTVMTPTSLITDRETLRSNPPDILLTNYKMLDYLLIRPKDKDLWSRNEPETLRYIVVDELHTFDGAQGTDLALLLRRLKARLRAKDDNVVYVGTSATLGSGDQTKPLCEYAEDVFGSSFGEDSVVTENRLDVAEFLGNAQTEFLFEPRGDLGATLAPTSYRSQESAVAGWFSLFFSGEPVPETVAAPAWRQHLGELLKRHSIFANLLSSVSSGPATLAEVCADLSDNIPDTAKPHLPAVLDALLVLIAWSRSPETASLPLVTLRVQIWLRELRRMVAPLSANREDVELASSSDLGSTATAINLPLIQCSDCRTTAWLTRLSNHGGNELSTDLEKIYNGWFGRATEIVRLYPGLSRAVAQVDGITQIACGDCGKLNAPGDECPDCGSSNVVTVFRTTGQVEATRGDSTAVYHDKTCPLCGANSSMLLIGSRATTLGSQVVEQSWGSVYNDDRKLIAFSDSVQDAAHRAGFISARTYSNTIRKAVAKGVEHLVNGSMPWPEFRTRFKEIWHEPGGPFFMDPALFVSEFIGPDMEWQRAWTDLYRDGGQLGGKSPLPERVASRLDWQVFAEFTYAGNRGRNLERLGVATLCPRASDLESAVSVLQPILENRYGMRTTARTVYWWLWGLVAHMRKMGAILEPVMGSYPQDGSLFQLTKTGQNKLWLPKMGPWTPHPTFLSIGHQKGFDSLLASGRSTWYSRWLSATIAIDADLILADREALYLEALLALQSAEIVKISTVGGRTSAGLNPGALHLWTEVLCLQTEERTHGLTVPADHAPKLIGMPCLEAPGERYRSIVEIPAPMADQLRRSALRRVIAAEHTGLLERNERESLERRFKARDPQPWYENLLSATPTLELGVDIGDLSSVMLCSVPPNVASFMQRIGRAGRRDGNAHAATVADGASPHDLYFYEEPSEMISGEVMPPGIFLRAPEVLRRQYVAFCLDDWVVSTSDIDILPEKTSQALDAVDRNVSGRFPYTLIVHAQKNRVRLFDSFTTLLGENATAEVKLRLGAFVDGADDVVPMHMRLLKALEEIAGERKSHTEHIKKLRSEKKILQKKPQDQATVEEIAQIDREEGKLVEIVTEINGRELLNTLTDSGLIPNYAFPEAGVELKSLLWRPATSEDNTTNKYVSLRALSYERPASSALSEFAPENRFYANQRRVRIDQINLALAKLEAWRLCPNCHHMQNLELDPPEHMACPRCGDEMWRDNDQKRSLLRFRQAIANSNDADVRIDDAADEREPKFYLRQLLVDFNQEDIREAWMLKSNSLPFGFEYIASASFRDINFGELGKAGEQFKVADRDAARPGFRLCRYCGKVQSPPRLSRNEDDDEDTQNHAFDCPGKAESNEENILTCLYLYREFKSEALRILVPFTSLGVDDPVVQSFSAALQLGIKRRYGGRVDHLRVTTQEAPDPEGGPRRRYLLIYDSVPGGTGYLHQMLAHDALTLRQILQMALEAIEACSCQSDPAKDGCYRCVYQYRLGRSMELVSRRTALLIMRDLVGHLDDLERTETISTIGLSQAIDSVLERRFLEGLRRLNNVEGLPRVTLIQEVVNGREGYHLHVGDNKYTIEMQVDLGQNDGVRRLSRPDFVIRPLSSSLKRKPIAVFCDGWSFHKDTVREDAAKRTAIVNSQGYWIWSVVSEDVEAAILGKADDGLPSPYAKKSSKPNAVVPPALPQPSHGTFKLNSLAELVSWLASPVGSEDAWVSNAWAASMCWLLRLVPNTQDQSTPIAEANREIRGSMPIWFPEPPPNSIDVALTGDHLFNIRGVWPSAVHQARAKRDKVPAIVWFDDISDSLDHERRMEWRWWLMAYNWLQTVPGVVLATRSGIGAGDYELLGPANLGMPLAPAESVSDAASAWAETVEQILSSLSSEAQKLANANCPPPDEVGYPLSAEDGSELSMAELVWLEPRIAVLSQEYETDLDLWATSGWNAVTAEPGWSQRVTGLLEIWLEENK